MRNRIIAAGATAILSGLWVSAHAQTLPGPPDCAGFGDVNANHPFCQSVVWAKNRAITLGCATDQFCPDGVVSRLVLVEFLRRTADSLFPLNCASGSVMKWNGAAWACAPDATGGGGGGGVTSLAQGTGIALSPNPIIATGTINLAPSYQLPQGCTNGQVPKINGAGAWSCAADNAGTGTGTVTSVTAGTGLTGGTITGAGTIAADPAYLQRRVGTACTAGSSIRAIAQDGSVTCEATSGNVANAFLNGGNNFSSQAVLGTLSNVPLQVFVNGSEALRIEPNPIAPRIIGGGRSNFANDEGGTVGGGGRAGNNCENNATGSPDASCGNFAQGPYATIAGGLANFADGGTIGGGVSNSALGSSATVAGGHRNKAAGRQATVAGGLQNVADEDFASIAGGWENTAKFYAHVGGGFQNAASGPYSVIGGGSGNSTFVNLPGTPKLGTNATIGGGGANVASGLFSTIGGGENNWADGDYATIPGGKANKATGLYSFASGFGANAAHEGSHVFADGQQGSLVSTTGANQFVVAAGGGIYLMTNRAREVGCWILGGNLSCTSNITGNQQVPSDRALKTAVFAVAPGDILDRVAALPIASWEYTNAPGVRHVGPMAQDFHAAFGLGESDRTIGLVDASGVALAAIQGLNAKLELALRERDALIAAQQAEITRQRTAIADLQAGRDDIAALKAAMAELLRERSGGVVPAALSTSIRH